MSTLLACISLTLISSHTQANAANANPWEWNTDYTTLTLTAGDMYFNDFQNLQADIANHKDTLTRVTAEDGAAWYDNPGGLFETCANLQEADLSSVSCLALPSLSNLFVGDSKLLEVHLPAVMPSMSQQVIFTCIFCSCTSLETVDMGGCKVSPTEALSNKGDVGMFAKGQGASYYIFDGSIQNIKQITMNDTCDLAPGVGTAFSDATGSFFDYKEDQGSWLAYPAGASEPDEELRGYDEVHTYQLAHPGITKYVFKEDLPYYPWEWSSDYSTLTLTGNITDSLWLILYGEMQDHADTLVTIDAKEGSSFQTKEGFQVAMLTHLKKIDLSQCVMQTDEGNDPLLIQVPLLPALETFKFSKYKVDGGLVCLMSFLNDFNLQEVDLGPSKLCPEPVIGLDSDVLMFATADVSTGDITGSLQNIKKITLSSDFPLRPGEGSTQADAKGSFFDYKAPGAWYAYQNNKLQATLVGYDEFRAYQETHPGVSTYYYGEDPGPEQRGWVWEDDGWRYYTEDGSYLTGGWQWVADDVYGAHWYYFYSDGFCAMRDWIWDGAWYYIQSDCAMACGSWNWIDGAWYGFNWDGTMCVGWIWDNSYAAWYYCYSNGIMARNTWVDSYWVDDSGRWIS